MELRYLGTGARRYGTRKEVPHTRGVWELQFFLRGSCTFLCRADGTTSVLPVVAGKWGAAIVSGPECVHGWGGTPDEECEVVVFHFKEVDGVLARVVGQAGFRALELEPGEGEQVRALAERCAAERARPSYFASRVYEIVARELALLLLHKLSPTELGPQPDFTAMKVVAAMAWYQAHLSSAPTIAEVAEAVHLSPAHLRRLFHRERGCAPQRAMTEAQFERALELMRDGSLTLEAVAENAGFGSASAFSRAFKGQFGVSPKTYRSRSGSANA